MHLSLLLIFAIISNIICEINYEKLTKILEKNNILYVVNKPLKYLTTFQIGGSAKIYVKPNNENELKLIIKASKELNIDYFIMGNGSNLLVSDEGYDGIVIHICKENFNKFEHKEINSNQSEITVGSGMLSKEFSKLVLQYNLTGAEDLVDLPGTIGGAITMNASFKKGISFYLKSCLIMEQNGEIVNYSKDEMKFSYRKSIVLNSKLVILEAKYIFPKSSYLKIYNLMKENHEFRYDRQPMGYPSAGCFLLTPNFLLRPFYKKYNLNKVRYGDVQVCRYSYGFFLNLYNAKSKDCIKLMNHINKYVYKDYKQILDHEVVFLGNMGYIYRGEKIKENIEDL